MNKIQFTINSLQIISFGFFFSPLLPQNETQGSHEATPSHPPTATINRDFLFQRVSSVSRLGMGREAKKLITGVWMQLGKGAGKGK